MPKNLDSRIFCDSPNFLIHVPYAFDLQSLSLVVSLVVHYV
jgi:hypothetical protein